MPQKDTLYGDLFVVGNFEANLIKKTGGTSSEFLKADGSVDSTAYLTTTPTLAQVTTAGNTTTNAITVDKLTVSTGTTKGVTLGGTSIFEVIDQPTYTQLGITPSSGNKSPVFLFYPSGTATASVMEFYHKSTLGLAERVIFKNNNGLLQLGGDAANIPIEFIGNNSPWMKIFATGNVTINSTTDAGFKLDVNGTARIQNDLIAFNRFHIQNGIWADYGTGLFGRKILSNESVGGLYSVNFRLPHDTGKFFFQSWNTNSTIFDIGMSAATLSIGTLITKSSITAATALAQGVYFNNTLVAAANNDVLVGLDINPTFTNGAFTGVSNIGLRVKGDDVNGGSGYSLYAYGGQAFIKGNFNITGGYNLIVQNRAGLNSLRVRGDGLTNLEKLEVSDGSNKGFTVSYSGVGGYQFGLAVTDAGVAFSNPAAANRPVSFSMNTGEILRIHQSYTAIVTNNFLIGTTTDAGQRLQVSGNVFIKGTTSLTATKVFEVQNGAGASIMDFRDNQYAFFGCGQGGGSNSGFIFNYSNTSYTQFAGYNYGAGAGSYKPILMDTDTGGRNQGIFVNFGVTTNTPPNSDTEFGVLGRTSDSTTYISRFRNSGNTDKFAIRADGALFTNTLQGYSGTLSIPTNPPGTSNITITNGLITNIA